MPTETETIDAESIPPQPELALAPRAVLGGLPIDDPAALQQELERYTTVRQIFVDWLLSHLVAGTDFMLIHRKVGPRGQKGECPQKADAQSPSCTVCGGKATLCKPGSEKLCGLLQLRPRFKRDVDTWEMLGGEAGLVTLVCELTTPTDIVVAEGRGARHRDQDFGDVNKCIKMCQKSAQVDAVLRCAGLSELFSQDIEDLPNGVRDEEPEPFEAPRRTQATTPKAVPARQQTEPLQQTLRRSVDAASAARRTQAADAAAPPTDALSDNRVRRLFALLHAAIQQADVPDDQHDTIFERGREWLTGWVATETGRAKLTHCPYKRYDELCDQVPLAVELAIQGGTRPQPRLVRRRPYRPAPQHPMH